MIRLTNSERQFNRAGYLPLLNNLHSLMRPINNKCLQHMSNEKNKTSEMAQHSLQAVILIMIPYRLLLKKN